MELVKTSILKIHHSILAKSATRNTTLFNALVTSMREHLKEPDTEVEIYIEEFDGTNSSGEETIKLFDSTESLNNWLIETFK